MEGGMEEARRGASKAPRSLKSNRKLNPGERLWELSDTVNLHCNRQSWTATNFEFMCHFAKIIPLLFFYVGLRRASKHVELKKIRSEVEGPDFLLRHVGLLDYKICKGSVRLFYGKTSVVSNFRGVLCFNGRQDIFTKLLFYNFTLRVDFL